MKKQDVASLSSWETYDEIYLLRMHGGPTLKVDGKPFRTIWPSTDGRAVEIIDQTRLPHDFVTVKLQTLYEVADAISSMMVRGAPLIGAAGAYGMCLALREDPSDSGLDRGYEVLLATRPTGTNLRWALDDMLDRLRPVPSQERLDAAYKRAAEICDEDVAINGAIGEHGFRVINEILVVKHAKGPVNILTHCNAGWLATVDKGTALAPVYRAHDSGIPVHVWVDETRPRNQGASLTAWELGKHGVPYTVVADNVGGHLMQHKMVDICLVGSDRTTASGDVCNKIGTYLKALAAHENRVPFYVALPSPTIDWTIRDGISEIPIEERDIREVSTVTGRTESGSMATVSILPENSSAANFAFDVTPARFVTGFITEKGVCAASMDGLRSLFPDRSDRL